MNFTFHDTHASYRGIDNTVAVTLRGDKYPSIFASGFVTAKAAVEDHQNRIRAAQIEAAWEAASHEQ